VQGIGNTLLGETVQALAVRGRQLWVGAEASSIGNGSTAITGVAYTTGAAGASLVVPSFAGLTGPTGQVQAATTFNVNGKTSIVIGGKWTTLSDGATAAFNLAWYGGEGASASTWAPLMDSTGASGVGTSSGSVNAVYDTGYGALLVAGAFSTLGNSSATAPNLAVFAVDAAGAGTWSTGADATGAGPNNAVRVIVGGLTPGDVYIGGDFTKLTGGQGGEVNVGRVAQFDVASGTWVALVDAATGATGVNDKVRALVWQGEDALWVAGTFTALSTGTAAKRVAMWTPSTRTWSSVVAVDGATGFNNEVLCGVLYQGRPYWGGKMTSTADGASAVSVKGLGSFNGTHFVPGFVDPADGSVGISHATAAIRIRTIGTYWLNAGQHALVIGGEFEKVGSVAARNLAALVLPAPEPAPAVR
jgi:hypothetical protein